MVIRFLMLLLIPFGLFGIATNNVDAEVQWDSIYANTPFIVTLSLTHDAGDKIDLSSFMANNKKISPIFVKSVKMTVGSPLEVSIYTLEMPGMPQGLQMLPAFSVKINDKVYSSIPSGYQVKGAAPAPAPVIPPPAIQKPIVTNTPASSSSALKLQAIFTGTNPLYPGQRFYFGYRYLYNTSIDLSEEKLPLLEAKGFKKIGDKQIENGTEQGQSVTQVIQKVEADLPGTFTFPESQIVGYTYTLGATGQKQYNKTPLTSNLPSFEVLVLPFPAKGKPVSFQGAIGNFDIQAALLSPNTVQVGDKIQLQLTVTGSGELDQLLPPDLCCQPGFSGFFKPSDLPPVTKVQGNTKTFLVELYVQNAAISAVPPIEFSFFNPVTKAYEKKITSPIPLTVTEGEKPEMVKGTESTVVSETAPFSPISIGKIFFIPLGLLALLGLAFLVFQSHLLARKEEIVEEKPAVPLSKTLFDEAKNDPDAFYSLAIKAIRQKMFEEGQIDSVNASLEKMPDSPLKTILVRLENTRFSKEAPADTADTIHQLERLIT